MRALITTDTVGGVWRFSHELIAGLLESGNAVFLISFGSAPSRAQQEECEQLTSRWGKAFRYVASDLLLEWMQNNEQCLASGAAVVAGAVKRFAPDVLHSNQFCFGAMPLEIPKIITAHSDVLSWAKACRSGPLPESPWLSRYRGMVQRGIDGATVVTAPTQWMLDALKEGFHVPGECRVIANGRALPPVPLPAVRRLQAITAGRLWDEAKDIPMLGYVSSPMLLLIAGETVCGSASLEAPPGVKPLGPLDQLALLQMFYASSVYVCTSRYEPFGLAPLEAALCGCAIVARDIPSLKEVWGDAAIYFKSSTELSECLARLHDDKDFLWRAQQNAIERAGRYTRQAMVQSYIALFAEVTELESVS